ncbi:MAG: hypothetical protein AAF481_01495 [Acidobacteriota bacterium]
MQREDAALGGGERGGALGRWLLRLLLAALLFGAVTFDRSPWPALVGDEATYAMQAASLAWDFDLRYQAEDYQRFLRHWGRKPDGLILQSRDGGDTITFGKPLPYALAVAPFVRLAPVRGAGIANALFLALAAIASARVLRRYIGPAADAWVAAFCFASVTFAYTFWVHADLFLLAASALGLALAHGGGRMGSSLPEIWQDGGGARRYLLAGMLLVLPGTFRPFYLALLVPAALAVPRQGRLPRIAALAAGALLVFAAVGGGQWLTGGSWTGYGGERQGFYERTGFPDIDFPAEDWSRSVERWGNTSWLHEGALERPVDRRLWTWNGLYFLLGQNVGVLPYFLPLLLGLFAMRGDLRGAALLLAVLAAVLVLFYLRPFNFFGGGGALANRYFLPVYPAFWYLAAGAARRRLSPGRGLTAAVAVVLLAAPYLYPLWTAPRSFPIADDGRYAYPSVIARRLLPYETTQSHIPGGRDVSHRGLWVKFLNGDASPADGGASLRLTGGRSGDLLIGSSQRLEGLTLSFGRQAPSKIEVAGGSPGAVLLRGTGGVAFDVGLDKPRAVHPMWWTWEDVYLYRLRIRLPGAAPVPLSFTVTPSTKETP